MPAATIDPEFELPASVAEVVALYARTVYDVRHFAHGSYTVGDAPLASFPMLSQVPPDPHQFPLAHWHDGAIALRFTADMRGELVEDGQRSSLDELIASGRATPIDGAFTVALAPGDSAVIAFEALRFELRNVPAARPPAYASGFRWDWWPHALAMFVLLGALLLIAQRRHVDARALDIERWPEAGRHVGPTSEPTATRTVRDRVRLSPRTRFTAGRMAHADDRGRPGRPTSRSHSGRVSVARRLQAAPTQARRFNPIVDAARSGPIGRVESYPGHFLASPYGAPGLASGLATHDRWGRAIGRPRDAHGRGGRGDHGTARGGAGWSRTSTLGLGHGHGGARRLARDGLVWREVGEIGPLTLADVRRILGWRTAALRRCGPLGAATLRFTIDGAGRVTDLAITPAGPRATRAARCVARRISRMWFPRGLGSLHVAYPLPGPTLQRPPA